MRTAMRLGCAALTLWMVVGCAGPAFVGKYRGPEPFGGKEYSIQPPDVDFQSPVQIVVLTFKDERPVNEHDLDWTRQTSPVNNTHGQPREVRKEFDRAIKAGLGAHPQIRLVSPESFAKTRKAGMVI